MFLHKNKSTTISPREIVADLKLIGVIMCLFCNSSKMEIQFVFTLMFLQINE